MASNRARFCPTTIDEAIAFRQQNPQAKIVAGATDVGVQLNKRVIEPEVFLDLNRVAELGRSADSIAASTREQGATDCRRCASHLDGTA